MLAQEHTRHQVDDLPCDHVGSFANRGSWISTASVMLHEFAHWAGNTNDNIGDVHDWKGDRGALNPANGSGPTMP